MMEPLSSLIEVSTSEATDSEVRVTLRDRSQGWIASLHGEVRGPRCVRARTLPAKFPLREKAEKPSASTLITDPCYWTPEMPFLYDLNLEVTLADGSTQQWHQSLGLKRLEAHSSNLFRERRRIVLRGLRIPGADTEVLQAALEAEISLVVANPTVDFLEQANEIGVSLVVDLRESDAELTSLMAMYSWHPAVECVLLNQQSEPEKWSALASVYVSGGEMASEESIPPWAHVIFVELGESEQPPASISELKKPVIAVRPGEPKSDFVAARRGCDQLQSALAPEFDLAGYFV